MKTLSLIAILAFATFNAFARSGNDGPSGVPRPKKPAVVAEAIMYCGFMCRNGDVKGVRILDNGEVEKFAYNRTHPENTEQLASLQPKVLSALQSQVEQMPETELVDQDESKPKCMDASTTKYSVQKFNGRQVLIGQNSSCHNYTLEYDQGKTIRGLLEGFMDFSN